MVDLLPAPIRWAVDEVHARLQVHCRYANLGKAELVRSIEVAAIGELIGLDHSALLRGNGLNHAINGRFAEPDEGHVMRMAPDVATVVIQVCGNLARSNRGVCGIIF